MAKIKVDPNFKEVEIAGRKFNLPVVSEQTVTAGMRRKTRNMSDDRANEELIWLVLEAHLSPEDLDALDDLTMAQLQELTADEGDDDTLGKE